jgi:SAM-dependent methyltransferase
LGDREQGPGDASDFACVVCGGGSGGTSWLGATVFDGYRFEYLECDVCRSLICTPLPSDVVIDAMYGVGYDAAVSGDGPVTTDPVERVVAWLAGRPAGTFLDHGCGRGHFLTAIRDLGWSVMGTEYDPTVAAEIASAIDAPVIARGELNQIPPRSVDVIHLGDVLEHLVDPMAELQMLIPLLKPGGHLLAQGPLEANVNAFTLAIKLFRSFGRGPAEQPPYHVQLTTASGQLALFERASLKPSRYDVWEAAWPAPSRISAAVVRQPRQLALYVVRQISRAVGAAMPRSALWGNRYFFAGQVDDRHPGLLPIE